MLCARTRADGSHGCRTRASAGGGRGAAGTGGHHAGSKTYSEVSCSYAVCLPWKGLPSLALALLIFMLPGIAYGAPSLEVDGNFAGYEDGEEYKGYVVVDSPDNYQSTLCLIGEWSKLPQITTEQYEILSNPSTGGAFYELSQLWKKLGRNASGTEEYYPQWLALSEDFADGLVTVYGYGKVWAAVCTDDLIEQAKQDFNTILGGGQIGGGGEPGTVIPSTITLTYNNIGPLKKVDKVEYRTFTVTLSNDVVSYLNTYKDNLPYDNYNLACYLQLTSGYNVDSLHFAFYNTDVISVTSEDGVSCLHNDSANRFSGQELKTITVFTGNDTLSVNSMNGTQSLSINANSNGLRYKHYVNFSAMAGGSGGSGGGTVEPSPDPWQPPTPSPDLPTNPTRPTPKDPITPDPPTLPGAPSDPVQPAPPQSPTVGDGGTFTVDLQGILDALDEHCIHIQTCLNSNFSGQNSYLGELFSTYTAAIVDQIYNGDVSKIGAIGDVNNTIAQGFSDIFEYWDDYTEWLDKKLDFKIPVSDPYDDKDLLSWLRKIWARQGTGDVNTRPVDPATNYGGMTKWLGVLYGEITGDVSDTSITALSTSLNALQHTFPFSLPWDIQQILQALDATPATPAASITVPALAGAWDAYSYDIDLHWLDTSMVAVRGFELLAFVLYCLVHTKDVFGYVVGD